MVRGFQISDDDYVLRRVPAFLPNYIKEDGSITRMAFKPKQGDDGLSVDLERLSSFEQATLGDSRFRLLRINVGVIRNTINDGLDVRPDPIASNSAHSLITGSISKGKQGQLLMNSEEVRE